jgi:tRNA A-37 threonylcarbamoyl transferase component Bud32
LHSKGIMHGDLYAHNTLFDDRANTIFGDFGAATLYDLNDKNAAYLEKLDVRAFGCLMEDLLNLVDENKKKEALYLCLLGLKIACLKDNITDRPSFYDIKIMLDTF